MTKPPIMLLAGLAAVVVTVAVGLSWKRIYYAIWPEARFWGRWEVVEVNHENEARLTIAFRRDGMAVFEAVTGFQRGQGMAGSVSIATGRFSYSMGFDGMSWTSGSSILTFPFEVRFLASSERIEFLSFPARTLSDARMLAVGWDEETGIDRRVSQFFTEHSSPFVPADCAARYRFPDRERLLLQLDDDQDVTLRRLPDAGNP